MPREGLQITFTASHSRFRGDSVGAQAPQAVQSTRCVQSKRLNLSSSCHKTRGICSLLLLTCSLAAVSACQVHLLRHRPTVGWSFEHLWHLAPSRQRLLVVIDLAELQVHLKPKSKTLSSSEQCNQWIVAARSQRRRLLSGSAYLSRRAV